MQIINLIKVEKSFISYAYHSPWQGNILLEQAGKLNVFPSGGRALHYWLDVFAPSRPSRGGSHEKTATLSYTFMGKQEGHGGVHVWTQGSP